MLSSEPGKGIDLKKPPRNRGGFFSTKTRSTASAGKKQRRPHPRPCAVPVISAVLTAPAPIGKFAAVSSRCCIVLLLTLSLAGCGIPDESIPPALAELHQRAVRGDAAAQLNLGLRYVTGKGIAPDERVPLRWIGKAAEQGNAAARFELGSYYTLEPHRDLGRAADLRRGHGTRSRSVR